MTEFQKDNEAKMAVYTENTGKIADYLFNKFFKIDQFDVYYDVVTERMEKGMCLEKAERLYGFFNDVNEIKKMVDFLNTVNPNLAKELVDGL